jgi:hypothetical protein
MCELKKLTRGRTGYHAAGLQQDDLRSEQHCFSQVVRHEDNRLLETARQRAEFPLKFRSRDRVQSAKRLVHQKNWRISGQRARNTYALALSTGEFARAPVSEFAWLQPNQLQQLFHTRVDALSRPVFQSWDQAHIFRDRKMGKQSGFLNHVTDCAS